MAGTYPTMQCEHTHINYKAPVFPNSCFPMHQSGTLELWDEGFDKVVKVIATQLSLWALSFSQGRAKAGALAGVLIKRADVDHVGTERALKNSCRAPSVVTDASAASGRRGVAFCDVHL
jgi:hypothetical protein